MAKVRIRPGVRGLDAKVVGEITITKNWTTVADDAVDGLLRYRYKGSSVIEVDEVPPAEVDEAPADFFIADDETNDTEDESDGTE